jgi:hypothetical protein
MENFPISVITLRVPDLPDPGDESWEVGVSDCVLTPEEAEEFDGLAARNQEAIDNCRLCSALGEPAEVRFREL